MVSEKKIFSCFSYYKPMVDVAPGHGLFGLQGAWPIWTPRGMVGTGFIKGIHTKYKSSGPHGFREDFVYVFPIVSL